MKESVIDPFDDLLEETIYSNPRRAASFAREIAELPLSSQLAIWRHRQEVTQERLARKLGLKQPQIARMESAGHDPRLSSVEKQTAALGYQVMFVPKPLVHKVLRLVAAHRPKKKP
jgi:DNA-binding phage protein